MSAQTILLIPLLAFLAPLIVRLLSPIVRIPIVVFEIVLGIVAGPAILGWVEPSDIAGTLADFGIAMLFFVAGSEIDFRLIRGRPLTRAALGWVVSLVIGVAAGLVLAPSLPGAIVVGIALCSTSLGALVPILRDTNDQSSPFGTAVTAIAAVGEFGPLIAISVFLSGHAVGPATLVLLAFVVIAALTVVVAARVDHRALHGLIAETLHSSGQIAIRAVMLILAALVALSIVLGLDLLLGAFVAGVLWRLIIARAPEESRRLVETKVEGIAFGFLVPIFFVYTGVTFDLHSLLTDPLSAALVPILLVALLLIRGLPSLLAVPARSTPSDKRAVVLMSATGLPIIVAVTAIGRDAGILSPGLAAALVGAGMLSVLLFPVMALAQRRRARQSATTTPPD